MKERLHPIQISILIYMIQNQIVLFSLPRLTAESYGTNGWLGLIFIYVLVNINIMLIAIIYKMGKGKSIFEIIETMIPKWVMLPVYLFIIGTWIGMASMVMKMYILIIKMFFFPGVPVTLFIVLITYLCFLLLKGGIYHISKASVLFFILTIWMIFLFIYLIPEFDFTRFTTFYLKGNTDFMMGSVHVYSAFLGFEISILFFHMVEKKWTKSIFIGNLMNMSIYCIITFLGYGFFSFNQLLNDIYPVITMLEYIEIPFLARVENLIFSFLAFRVILTIVIYYWGAQQVCRNINSRLKPNYWMLIILTVGIFISLIPETLFDVEKWLDRISYFAIGIAWLLPLFVLCILYFQNLMNRGNSDAN
jgi:spore germination protein (amino acid permease)